jgi:hypothetical protein
MRPVAEDIDYIDVQVPELDPKDFNYQERRAEILQFIFKAGHPYGIKQIDLARRYGVSGEQISQDVKVLRLYIRKTLGDNYMELTKAAFERCYRDLLDMDKPKDAFDVVMQWSKWLEARGIAESKPQVIEIKNRLPDMSKDEIMGLLNELIAEKDGSTVSE